MNKARLVFGVIRLAGYGILDGLVSYYIPGAIMAWLAFMCCALLIDIGSALNERSKHDL